MKSKLISAGLLVFYLAFMPFSTGKAASEIAELLPSSIPLPKGLHENPRVKILIFEGNESCTLRVPSSYILESIPDLTVLERGVRLSLSPVTGAPNGIQIGKMLYNRSHLKLVTQNQYFEMNKRQFHDDLHLIKTTTGKLDFVNDVEMEDYLKGVLPWEVSETWPIEALKAQAVVVRTYALFKMLERQGR